jgi:serine/threonine protein phosphatase PrpC
VPETDSNNIVSTGPEIITRIKRIHWESGQISLCSFLLNCQHKQDACSVIIHPSGTLYGGIVCDGVSESPASGLFANYLVEKVKNWIENTDPPLNLNELTVDNLTYNLDLIIKEFFISHRGILTPGDLSPKSTFILYLTGNNSAHYFYYLGDGKIIVWDPQSDYPPAELLLEYHNETGALLNAVRKEFLLQSTQYPISKIIYNNPVHPNRFTCVLLASDGLEPYYEDFLGLFQKNPALITAIQNENHNILQEILVKDLFDNLSVLPNDDISLILLQFGNF